MSVLGDVREAIASVLSADMSVQGFSYIPGRITPPCVMVAQGSPYVESGDVYGTFRARFSVDVVSATAPNDVTTESLDLMIEDALVSLVNQGINIENVGQPYALDTNNATYLAATITINTTTRL